MTSVPLWQIRPGDVFLYRGRERRCLRAHGSLGVLLIHVEYGESFAANYLTPVLRIST